MWTLNSTAVQWWMMTMMTMMKISWGFLEPFEPDAVLNQFRNEPLLTSSVALQKNLHPKWLFEGQEKNRASEEETKRFWKGKEKKGRCAAAERGMMLPPHGAGGIHEGGGRGDRDLETEIKSWQPEGRNSGVFWTPENEDDQPLSLADNLDLIPKCPTAKWKLKDEIRCVVGNVFNSSRIDALLVQYWAPITTDGKAILTTQNQPFALSKIYKGLCWYRMISKDYKFYVDGETTEQQLGLPGRVFKHQLVESSPNVEYYSNKEYPQRKHALRCQIRATLALPVFEPTDHTCVGVLELLFTTRDAFLIFLEEGCAYDAFLGLDLKCLNLWEHPRILTNQIEDKNEAALRDEILDVLKLVLEVHRLPLAQIWRTCRVCRSLFNNGVFGLSRMSGLSYLMEENGEIFLRACGHHHLRMGMGVVGTALKSLNLVFCADVTQFSITEYPMTHYAREFGLSGCGCFSVCLRSSNPGNDIYVLEFFLPVSNKVGGNVMTSLMKEILGTMRKKIQSFKLASGEELGEELIVEVIDFQHGEKKIRTLKLSSGEELGEEFSEVTDFHNGEKLNSVQISQTRPEPLQNGADLMELESSDQQSMDAVNNESNVISAERSNSTCSQKLKRKQNKTGGKIEIFLEDILQTSQMKIEDAAKSLHVSISTLKRACRKFGIPRWSRHHINQLNKNGGNSVQISPTTGSLPRLEPLQKQGDMMQLNSSDQQSMDAINITNVVGAEQSNIAVTCSQEKYAIKRSERERIKTGIRIEIPPEGILQASEMSLNDAANSLHVSKSALKRVCRDYDIQKWPPSKITKFSVGSLPTGSLPRLEPLQNEGDMMQHQQSMDAINIGAEQSNIGVTCSQEKYAIKRSEREHKNTGVRNAIHIEDILQTSEMRIQDAANSLHVSISTLKRACRKLGISRWPPRHINKINKNGGSSVQISPTTGSLPRSEPLKNEGDMMQLDSLDQQSRDATKSGGAVICSQEKGTMKMPYREDKKTGVRIAMPSEHILQTSKESLEGAAEHHGASQFAFKSAGSRKITRSLPRPGPLQNGDDQMMQLDSSDQQSMDALNITNVVSAEQSNIAVTCSHEKDAIIKRSEREHKKKGVKIAIPIEDLLQASEMSLNDAACRLNVSKSALKRVCRGYGIEKWPPSKRPKFSCSQLFDEKQIQKLDPGLSSNQAGNIVSLTKPHNTATKDAEIVTIKAKYGNDIVIKFPLSSSSGLVELWQEVARRLNLDPETYHIKYKDEDGDLILIACDDDLLGFITSSRTLGNTTILLLLEPSFLKLPTSIGMEPLRWLSSRSKDIDKDDKFINVWGMLTQAIRK
ncbi:unnamed protein product [Camellia sinensis]